MVEADPRAILRRWGDFDFVGPLAGGHRNQAFRVRSTIGEFVLKSTRRSEAAIEWQVGVQRIAQNLGIVVPCLKKGWNNAFVQDGWTLEDFVEGEHPETIPPDLLQSVIPSLHAATRVYAQRPGFVSSLDLLSVGSGGDVDLGQMPDELVIALRAAWEAVKNAPQSVVHGDINVSNLVEMADGNIALLDWDETRFDFSFYDEMQCVHRQATDVVERAAKAFEIACSWQVEPEYARRLAQSFLA